MNFIEALERLKSGEAVAREVWGGFRYLVKGLDGQVSLFDGYAAEPYDLDIEDALSLDWKECERKILYITGIQYDYRLVDDQVFARYELKKVDEKAGEWDAWNTLVVQEADLKRWACLVTLLVSSQAGFADEERERIKKALH